MGWQLAVNALTHGTAPAIHKPTAIDHAANIASILVLQFKLSSWFTDFRPGSPFSMFGTEVSFPVPSMTSVPEAIKMVGQ